VFLGSLYELNVNVAEKTWISPSVVAIVAAGKRRYSLAPRLLKLPGKVSARLKSLQITSQKSCHAVQQYF
jgi:hypothetical protein